MKTIVILATAHEYQCSGHALNQDLKKRIEYLCKKFAVEILLEEWTASRDSFAEGLAQNSKDSALQWKNIGTGQEERFRTWSAPVNHPGHEGTLPPDEDAPSMSEYGPFPSQENREKEMVKNVAREMQSYNAGLLLVGLAHLHSIFGKLLDAGFNVVGFNWLEIRQQ